MGGEDADGVGKVGVQQPAALVPGEGRRGKGIISYQPNPYEIDSY